MINVDRDALICDLAETYHVFDFKSLPCKLVGILSCGLRDNSRIKMSLSGEELNLERALLAGIYDNTKILSWLNSSDGAEGINRPESIFKSLLKDEEDDSEILSFESKTFSSTYFFISFSINILQPLFFKKEMTSLEK